MLVLPEDRDGVTDPPSLRPNALRIATWNCGKAGYAKRAPLLDPYGPSLTLFQEIGRPPSATEHCRWFGANPLQCSVVAVDPSFGAKEPVPHEYTIPSCVPIRIAGPRPFRVLLIWAQKDPRYVEAIWRDLDRHAYWIRAEECVIAGDFNSTPAVERSRRHPCHRDLADRLRDDFGLVSAYHAFYGLEHGEEEHPTYYHQRRRDRPFHLDYCFVPASWRVRDVRVGAVDDWCGYSDHCPVVVDLERP
jgi:exodeoxyribonuclease-3